LLVCTNRLARYRIASDAGGTDVQLAEGEALLLGPKAPVANISEEPYRSLGIIFYPESIRLYGIRYRWHGGASAPDPLRLQYGNYVHPVPLGEDGRRLLACALNAAGFEAETPYRGHLVAALLAQVRLALGQQPMVPQGKAARTFRTLVRHVEAHLAEPITRDDLAHSLHMHPNHVSRLFGQFSNCTFREFLRRARLARAERLLALGTWTVGEVAYACGFGSSSSFVRAFHRQYGLPPARWAASREAASAPVDRTVTTCGLPHG
jgi:AraC-like DNA-binding protein